MLISRSESTESASTSAPGWSSPSSKKTSVVRQARPASSARRLGAGVGEPGEAGDVVGLVLDVLAEDDAVVGRGGGGRAERRPRAVGLGGDAADGLGGAADGLDRGAGELGAEEARRTARSPAGGRGRARSSARGRSPGRRSASGGPRWSNSPTIRTRSVSKASASRVGRTVPSIEFSNGTRARSAAPVSTASTAAWIVATGSGSKRGAGGGEVAEPPPRRSRRDRGRRPSSVSPPRRRAAARLVHRRQLLGRELEGRSGRRRSASHRRGPGRAGGSR